MIATLLTITLGCVAVSVVARGHGAEEVRVVWMGYVLHVAASFAQYGVTLYWYGGGDMFLYSRTGSAIAQLLAYDFARFSPEVLALLFHQPAQLPLDVIGAGSSTGSMMALASVLLYLLGDSVLAACVLLSTLAFVSRVVLTRVVLSQLPADVQRGVRLGMLLLPSVTFWGATIAKETMVLIGLGPLAALGRRLADPAGLATRAWIVPLGLCGATLIWLVKSYVLVAFLAAAAAWWFTQSLNRSGKRLRRWHLVAAAGLTVGAVLVIGQLMPSFSVDALAERAAELQAVGQVVRGGSSYEIGSGERSAAGQVAFIPLALISTLFRPFLFEVRNPLMLLNSLETTWLLVLVAQSLRRGRLAGLFATARESPVMAFSVVFVVLVAVGVGLTTTNLGTLTRYRAPMMPFYAAFLVVWHHRCRPAPRSEGIVQPAPPQVRRRLRAAPQT